MRPTGVLLILAVSGLVAVSCVPFFPVGSGVIVDEAGAVVVVRWPAALEVDEGEQVSHYDIEVDGVVVGSVAAPATLCVLAGLAPNTSYNLAVSAVDDTGEWSGQVTAEGYQDIFRPTGEITTPADLVGGPLSCTPGTDTDGDRLPDIVETDTGVFTNLADTGTDPFDSDTDGDAIDDGDEVLGTADRLDLPALGVSPLHQDLLLEFDWFDDALDGCGAHSHQPSATAMAMLAAPFAASPVTNPDGTTGINVIADHGQGGLFVGGGLIDDPDGVIAGGVSGADYLGYKQAHFAAERDGYFHYVLMPHRYNTSSGSSGQAELSGDDMIVSLYCYGSDHNVATTSAHELGHNLGLHHGGSESRNNKPNYNSVMNYLFQFPGIDTDCTPSGNGVIDYSSGARVALDENDLDEAGGLCGGVAWDWNGDTVVESGVAQDINGDGGLHVLSDHDDWANLYLSGVGDADGVAPVGEHRSFTVAPLVTEQPIPPAYRTD